MANGIVLNLDTTKSEFQNPMIELRQGDGNYQSLDVTVTSNGEPFDLTGWTTTFMGTTAGGFKIIDSAVTVTNALQGEFTYTPTKAWGQDQGEFKNAYFKFVKADETASSASFRVNVLDAVDLTSEEAGNYISIVDQTISKLSGDLSTLQRSVDDLKAQNNAIKTTDNTWVGSNTFNKKIIAPTGVQGNADSATKLQTPRKINGTDFDGTVDINVTASNDSDIVHKSGNETIAGAKAFTDRAVFNKAIYGKFESRFLPDGTNLYTLIENNVFYSVPTVAKSQTILNKPDGVISAFGIMAVDVGGYQQNSYAATNLIMFEFATGNMFIASLTSNSTGQITVNKTWTKVATDDRLLVHKTGTETVAGDKAFTGTTTLNNVISSNVKNASIAFNGLTVSFMEGATGVDTSIIGNVDNRISPAPVADDTWHILGNIPANIAKPKIDMYTSYTGWSSTASGSTTRANFRMMLSFNTTGVVNYRLTSLNQNDSTSTYTPLFLMCSSLSWNK